MIEDLGTITPCYTMTFERTSKHSAARMWRALTEPDEVGNWMEGPATIDLRVGGTWRIDFSHHHQGGEGEMLDGVIIRVEPERILAYSWGLSVVQWTITDADDGCTYTFVHTGCADRGEDEEGLPAGWHGFLDQLDKHLDGEKLAIDEAEAQWYALKPSYLKQLESAIR